MNRYVALCCAPLIAVWAAACVTHPIDPEIVDSAPELPEHNECLPEGEQMTEEVCLRVVDEDGRLPTQSYYKADVARPDPDLRLTDADYLWLTDQVKRCTCSCCHTASYGGPGVYHWDLEFEPMWIDSASDWALQIFAGDVYSESQVLPVEDQDRMRAVIQRELERRANSE